MTKYKLIYVKDAKEEEHRGTSYIRWGRMTCENNSTLVYKGRSVYKHFNMNGTTYAQYPDSQLFEN